MAMNSTVHDVTQRIIERSRESRADYLRRMNEAGHAGPHRGRMSCSNLAHGFAAEGEPVKDALAGDTRPNVGIVTAFNDMLSAHQPFERYPDIIKQAAWNAGGVAQVAGGTPAMCDGVTQGQPGMELSLFSRDVIAMSTGVALTHNMFDAALCLGVCDKIVPGLLIGTLAFGHLPVIFAPAGPMTSGMANPIKAKVRERFAQGEIGRDELLKAESMSYHSPGTCTFYGTANSNQLMMEFMGLHMAGTSFINPGTPLREALTVAATERAIEMARLDDDQRARRMCDIVDEKSIVNGLVGLLSSGGSTNHTMHYVAVARAAGIKINWDDFSELSAAVPLLARVYPNGIADVNHMRAAGGIQLMIRSLLDAGLLHDDVMTVEGYGLHNYTKEPYFNDGALAWREGPTASHDEDVMRPADNPFAATGGINVLDGNVGRAIIKTSAVETKHRRIEAPAQVFASQQAVLDAFKADELNRDVVVVVPNNGPRANGMPELHKLTPSLSVLLHRGYQVALVTDGRMSGASGKVPAAIQVTPEAKLGGMIGRIRDGDIVVVDADTGELSVQVDDAELAEREAIEFPDEPSAEYGLGREMFALFRNNALPAEEGAGPALHG
ncbi:phosphogluconate dehydratase [Salinisphaera japonica]|uniref:Phosphogluconate dehydratase n=1 Tax=Salinisphaera japonica YTM-1 TaxID=1209778 RepID=A0A423PRD0_9GAMM|nr:phosphogluconate dehydratase [Salinisphaera japonica]ROO28118.1 phosphogluconate dehydratase [Salinisphaera japonica YTM-1]